MRIRIAFAAGVAALVGACAHGLGGGADGPPKLTVEWRLDRGLANPESVLASPDGRFFYVSNVAGEGDAKDGVGYIVRVDPQGRLLEPRWAEGLNAPKGMALVADQVLVSDIDRLVALDARTGQLVADYPAPGARFLNDVAVTPKGTVLVSDSGTAQIYALAGGALSPWASGPLLASVNGLFAELDRLVVATMQGRLLAIDYQTRAITVLAEGLGNADGAARWGDGYLVSAWPGELFWVQEGVATQLMDTREAGIYQNDFLLTGQTLLMPNFEPSTLTRHRLE